MSLKRLFSFVFLALALPLIAACGGSPTDPSTTANVPYSATDLTVGTGKVAGPGNRATVNYTVWLYSPTAAENKGNFVQNGAFAFVIGAGSVVKGFDQGATGMAVGGKRRLI